LIQKPGIKKGIVKMADKKQITVNLDSDSIAKMDQGAGNFIVNFLKPRYTGGILVEFVESLA